MATGCIEIQNNVFDDILCQDYCQRLAQRTPSSRRSQKIVPLGKIVGDCRSCPIAVQFGDRHVTVLSHQSFDHSHCQPDRDVNLVNSRLVFSCPCKQSNIFSVCLIVHGCIGTALINPSSRCRRLRQACSSVSPISRDCSQTSVWTRRSRHVKANI